MECHPTWTVCSGWPYDPAHTIRSRIKLPLFTNLKKLLISQNRDGQPTVKFHMQHYAIYIYSLIFRTSFFMLFAAVNAPRSHQEATNWSDTKNASYPRKSGFLGINRYINSTSDSMSNLKLGCVSRSQEKWTPKKWDFFQGLSFLQSAGFENWKIRLFWKCDFLIPSFL
jgi:hypothetical protein